MINAQEWLDQEYPLAKRSEITYLNIRNKKLTGELKLIGFSNLTKLKCYENQLTNLDLTPCPKLTTLFCSSNKLTNLDLTPCPKLTELYCYYNNLTNLDLTPCPELTKLNCYENNLTNLDLTPCPKLTELNCHNNNLSSQDLSVFSQLFNLKKLDIGNSDQARISANIYNHFLGSLSPLAKLTKLKNLNINNTDLNSGVEYLPSSINMLDYNNESNSQIKTITAELDEFNKDKRKFYAKRIKASEQKTQFLTERLNEYLKIIKPKLGDKLGVGAFGTVYQGTWKDNPAAIKKPNISTSQLSEKELEAFEKEVEILKKLNNPYIILYVDMFKDEQDLMIITELAQHGALTDYINQNKEKEHDWNTNYNFIKQMTLGLTYLHHSNIIHRDLKSLNILICEGNIAKLADFGLSKVIDNLTINKTASKGLKGTIRWSAPEVLKTSKHSFESDIYSFGMVIWEIVTKETIPFKQFEDYTIIFNVGNGDSKEVIPTDIPKELVEIINFCWKTNPQERIGLKEIESGINKLLIWKEKPPQLENKIEMKTN